MRNVNLSLSSLIITRSANNIPYVTSNFKSLTVKKSSFNQLSSTLIRSSLRDLFISSTKFRHFLSTAVIIDSYTYESTNYTSSNIPTIFNSITSVDGIVEFKDVLFYEIQQNYLEACAFQCTSKVNIVCNQVSFVNLFLSSNIEGTGACFRLEKTKNCIFKNCCFYKVVGVSKASQICGLIRASSVLMRQCSFNPMSGGVAHSKGFYIDKTLMSDTDSNYTSFGSQNTGILFFCNGYESDNETYYQYCSFFNNTCNDLSVLRVNRNGIFLSKITFKETCFYLNTQLFLNECNVSIELGSCYICKSPFGLPAKVLVSYVFGDVPEYNVIRVENIEFNYMIPFFKGIRAFCKVYYHPTKTKSVACPTKSLLPYGHLEFETKVVTVNAKVSIYIVTGIIITIIIVTTIIIIVTQRVCPLFNSNLHKINRSDDSVEIDEKIYDEEVPILNTEQKRKIESRISDALLDLDLSSNEIEFRMEVIPAQYKHRLKRVKKRRHTQDEYSHTNIIDTMNNQSDSLSKPMPRQFNMDRSMKTRDIKSFDPSDVNMYELTPRANHMRIVEANTGSNSTDITKL